MSEKDIQSRRSVLQTIATAGAAATAVTGVTGGVAGRRRGRRKETQTIADRTAEDAGIRSDALELVEAERYDELTALLEEHDVSHSHRKQYFDGSNEPSGEVSAQDFAIKSNSSVDTMVFVDGTETFDDREWDTLFAIMWWDLDFQKDFDAPAPVDAASIFWEANVFGSITGTVSHDGDLIYTIEDDINNVTSMKSPNLGDGTEGITISFDDTRSQTAPPGNNPAVLYPDEGEGRLQLRLRRQNKSYGTVRCEYGHTWSVGGNFWNPDNLTLSLPGPLSYNIGYGGGSWALGDSMDR